MAETLEDNFPWFLSLMFHVILYLIIININNDLRLKNDTSITISIISPPKKEVFEKKDDEKQIKTTKKIKNHGYKKAQLRAIKKKLKISPIVRKIIKST